MAENANRGLDPDQARYCGQKVPKPAATAARLSSTALCQALKGGGCLHIFLELDLVHLPSATGIALGDKAGFIGL
jgi:hypothetical protein